MTYRELSTILAALRMFQQADSHYKRSFDHFDKRPPLTDNQINTLCEELNTNQEISKIRLTGIS